MRVGEAWCATIPHLADRPPYPPRLVVHVRDSGRPFYRGPAVERLTMAKDDTATAEVVTVGSRTPVWDQVTAATEHKARIAASRRALEMVTLPDLTKPVPMFFVDLPWVENREAAQDEILARIIAAESLEAASTDDALLKLEEVVGKTITIHGVVARAGTIDDGWGAYASLDVTVGADETHRVINTSSKEVCVVTWRAHCENRFPLTALVILKGNPTPGRDQPVGLVVEQAF